jgi:hypothetical protein
MRDECPKNLRPGNSSWAECRCYNLAMYAPEVTVDGKIICINEETGEVKYEVIK